MASNTTLVSKPKGFYTKGNTKSEDATIKAKARQSLTPRGLASMVLNAAMMSPIGREAKITVGAEKVITALSKEAADQGAKQLAKKTASDKLARAIAEEAAGSKNKGMLMRQVPKGSRGTIKPTTDTKSITITKTAPKEKTFKPSLEQKNLLRKQEIKQSLLRPKGGLRGVTPVSKPASDAVERYYDLLDSVKGKKVQTGTDETGKPILMDAVQYLETKMQMRLAQKNPANSLAKLREPAGPLKDVVTINGEQATAKQAAMHEAASMRDYTDAMHPKYVQQTNAELEQILNDYFKHPKVKAQDAQIAKQALDDLMGRQRLEGVIKNAPQKTFRGKAK